MEPVTVRRLESTLSTLPVWGDGWHRWLGRANANVQSNRPRFVPRTTPDRYGFLRLIRPRSKTVHGFATGDMTLPPQSKEGLLGSGSWPGRSWRRRVAYSVSAKPTQSDGGTARCSIDPTMEPGYANRLPPGPEGPGFPVTGRKVTWSGSE